MTPIQISRIAAPTLHLRQWGSGDVTCLLIHGFGESGFVWNGFAEILAPYCRVVAIDLRGHGDSDWDVRGRYGTSAHLSDISYTIDALGMRSLLLVGHSMGGQLAMRLAANYSERTVGLLLVDSGPEFNEAAVEYLRREFAAEHQSYPTLSQYIEQLRITRPFSNPLLLEQLAKSRLRSVSTGGYQLKSDPAMGDSETSSKSDVQHLWTILERIMSPTMAVRGIASSVLQSSTLRRMVSVLRDGRSVTIEKAGHAVMTDNPEAFSAATVPFILERLAAERRSGCS